MEGGIGGCDIWYMQVRKKEDWIREGPEYRMPVLCLGFGIIVKLSQALQEGTHQLCITEATLTVVIMMVLRGEH